MKVEEEIVMGRKNLTCIGWGPMGCNLTVKLENGEVIDVKGNNCGIGLNYAKKRMY